MRNINSVAYLICSPIFGFVLLSILTYCLLYIDSYMLGEELSSDSSTRGGVVFYLFIAIPTFLYVLLSNILFYIVLTKMGKFTQKAFFLYSAALASILIMLGFMVEIRSYENMHFFVYIILPFLVSFTVIHCPGIYFYKLVVGK